MCKLSKMNFHRYCFGSISQGFNLIQKFIYYFIERLEQGLQVATDCDKIY